MPLGTPLKTFIYDIGEGGIGGRQIKAVQTGGPSGGCIPPEMFDTPVDYESLAQLGSIMGSGGMVVMDEDNCMVDVARYFVEFTHSESCGKCIPCRVGLNKSLRILNRVTEGAGTMHHLELLDELSRYIRECSLVRFRADRAQPGSNHATPLPHRVRRPHCVAAMPSRRLPRAGAVPLREQLSAAHEHSALPAVIQRGSFGGRI
jgi:NADH:ubiquinone oxidoreductase subunit F (NADH-binding)